MTSCLGADITTPLSSTLGFDVGFEVAEPVGFDSATTNLGCFYVTGFAAALIGTVGWDVGLTFDNLNGGTKSAKMASKVYTEDALPPTASCLYNTVNARMPLTVPDNAADQVCTAVEITPVASSTLEVRTNHTKKKHICPIIIAGRASHYQR